MKRWFDDYVRAGELLNTVYICSIFRANIGKKQGTDLKFVQVRVNIARIL